MNVASWLLWGFVATVVLTTILASSQGLGLTRMNIPFLLGTMFHELTRPATRTGFFVHLVNGWLFALIYVAGFHAWGGATWWRGAAIGLVHASFVLAALMPVMPSLHPRMAGESEGPGSIRKLEPPGFLALHYGVRTPVSVVAAHLVYGAILGAFYRVS
jgi:uncharacterized membrane protein YagU involved in acid resistance